jgi:hypothetical protein
MTGEGYKKILNDYLFKSINDLNLEDEWYLLQDNDPKHTSNVVRSFLSVHDVEMVQNYPPNSPDLNPIENLWNFHARKVHARKPKNLKELRKFIKEEWYKLSENIEFLRKLISSMKDRLEEVIAVKGWYTHY